MAKKAQYEGYALAALVVILAVVGYRSYSGGSHSVVVGETADVKFTPLDVTDPSLRVDLLNRMRTEEYKGQRRNIFSAAPLPPPPSVIRARREAAKIPAMPPPPPPVIVPATFYGIVTDLGTGEKRACFSANSDDVYIVPEGGILLHQFRVMKINPNSVDLEEISSGRATTLMLVPPAEGTPQPPQQVQP